MERLPSSFDTAPSAAASKLPIEAVFASYRTTPQGLSDEEALARFEKMGPNELTAKRVTGWTVFRRQFVSPMTSLLAVAAIVSFWLGEWIDGVTIAVMLAINSGIGFCQEYRSERTLEKLRSHLTAHLRVRRQGHLLTIERKRLVPGDLVLLQPGDVVPADLRVSVAHRLTLDESVLTGESIVAQKRTEAEPSERRERAGNMAYLMTLVVAGYGEGIVTATGRETVIGRIAVLTENTVRVSAFEKSIQDLSRFLLKAVLAVLCVLFFVNVLLKGESQVVPQFLFAIALAVSVIPEALPAITSLTLSSGAMRLAKRHVVVKRLSAIEDLGHMEILCTDKTGTITEGIMTVDTVVSADPAWCLERALFAADEGDLLRPSSAPKTFDAALAVKAGVEASKRAASVKRAWFSPFDPSRRRATAVCEDGSELRLIVLGAAEEILARSTRMLAATGEIPMSAADVEAEREAVRVDGLAGRRVLALATKCVERKNAYDDSDEQELVYAGRIAFLDPLKATAKASIEEAERLHVRVKILTGDSPEVAAAIGLEIGILKRVEDVVTGEALEQMSYEERRRLIEEAGVFARVTPEQKFMIIEELQRAHRVGFLGEGINDAPALKVANVALAVDGASDVAREAADIILLRKDLRVIVDGVRQGRAIFTNIVKYVKYTLVGNFGNFIAIAGVSLLIDDLPMLPIQILLTNLLTDLPLVSVAGDAVDEEEVAVPKRFNMRELAFIGVFLGLVSSFFDFAYFALNRGDGIPAVRTLWFLFSVLTELALIYSIRTRGPMWKASRPGSILVLLTGLTALGALALTYSPFGHEVFQFISPTVRQLAGIGLLAAAYLVTTEIVKSIYAKIFQPSPQAV